MASDPRGTQAWKRLRVQVVQEEPTCRLQLDGICTQVSTEADHIVPVEDAPHLALVRSNVRGTCTPCNRARGRMPDHMIKRADTPPALAFFDVD